MKILISTDTYYPHVNGASYFTQRLAHYLVAAGHDVRVLAPSRSFHFTDEEIDGVRVYGMRSYPMLFYKGFRFCAPFFLEGAIGKVMDDLKPDILHIQGHFSVSRSAVRVAHRRGTPIVATNHFMPENLMHYLHAPAVEGAIKRVAWWDFARIFKKAKKVTTPTRTAAAVIQPYLPLPVEAISCGIDLGRFTPEKRGGYLKERYHIADRPTLLYVGRLDKEKNVDLVLSAFARIAHDTDIQVVIAGNGAEKPRLVKLAHELGVADRVVFTGFVPNEDLPALYSIADCFVIACTVELQSIVTMEAMASGVPIIAVRACALPELVTDGENGFLFEPDDEVMLAEKMKAMFAPASPRAAMGKKSLEMIQKHDIKKTIARFGEIYREVQP